MVFKDFNEDDVSSADSVAFTGMYEGSNYLRFVHVISPGIFVSIIPMDIQT